MVLEDDSTLEHQGRRFTSSMLAPRRSFLLGKAGVVSLVTQMHAAWVRATQTCVHPGACFPGAWVPGCAVPRCSFWLEKADFVVSWQFVCCTHGGIQVQFFWERQWLALPPGRALSGCPGAWVPGHATQVQVHGNAGARCPQVHENPGARYPDARCPDGSRKPRCALPGSRFTGTRKGTLVQVHGT